MKKKLSTSVLLFAFITSIAGAIGFNFTHTGFEEGASVSGSFAGEDNDSNGFLLTNEVTSFSMQWSGNSLVPAFSLSLADLLGFGYELNGGPTLGDLNFEGIVGFNSVAYVAGEGGFLGLGLPSNVVGGLILSGASASATLALPTVTGSPVPDSSTGNLGFGALMLFLLGIARRFSARK